MNRFVFAVLGGVAILALLVTKPAAMSQVSAPAGTATHTPIDTPTPTLTEYPVSKPPSEPEFSAIVFRGDQSASKVITLEGGWYMLIAVFEEGCIAGQHQSAESARAVVGSTEISYIDQGDVCLTTGLARMFSHDGGEIELGIEWTGICSDGVAECNDNGSIFVSMWLQKVEVSCTLAGEWNEDTYQVDLAGSALSGIPYEVIWSPAGSPQLVIAGGTVNGSGSFTATHDSPLYWRTNLYNAQVGGEVGSTCQVEVEIPPAILNLPIVKKEPTPTPTPTSTYTPTLTPTPTSTYTPIPAPTRELPKIHSWHRRCPNLTVGYEGLTGVPATVIEYWWWVDGVTYFQPKVSVEWDGEDDFIYTEIAVRTVEYGTLYKGQGFARPDSCS